MNVNTNTLGDKPVVLVAFKQNKGLNSEFVILYETTDGRTVYEATAVYQILRNSAIIVSVNRTNFRWFYSILFQWLFLLYPLILSTWPHYCDFYWILEQNSILNSSFKYIFLSYLLNIIRSIAIEGYHWIYWIKIIVSKSKSLS